MKEKITVTMTEEALFDFMLYHTYSKIAGVIVNILGVAVAILGIIFLIMGKATPVQFLFYIAAGAVFIGYTPFQLKSISKKLIHTNKEYDGPSEYEFDEQGITRTKEDRERVFTWEQIQKVVATPKTIGFYYGSDHAVTIPKESFGEQYMPIMKIVAAHIKPENIKMK